MARNLDRLTLDNEHLQRQEESRRTRPQGMAQGLYQGLTGFGMSLLGKLFRIFPKIVCSEKIEIFSNQKFRDIANFIILLSISGGRGFGSSSVATSFIRRGNHSGTRDRSWAWNRWSCNEASEWGSRVGCINGTRAARRDRMESLAHCKSLKVKEIRFFRCNNKTLTKNEFPATAATNC